VYSILKSAPLAFTDSPPPIATLSSCFFVKFQTSPSSPPRSTLSKLALRYQALNLALSKSLFWFFWVSYSAYISLVFFSINSLKTLAIPAFILWTASRRFFSSYSCSAYLRLRSFSILRPSIAALIFCICYCFSFLIALSRFWNSVSYYSFSNLTCSWDISPVAILRRSSRFYFLIFMISALRCSS
jgi:hypothetical protein